MAFFSVIIELVDGKYDYDVPDIQLISGAKYKWDTANRGTPGLPQGTCYFEYPIELGDNLPRRSSITSTDYDNFASIAISPETATYNADGIDGVELEYTFPEEGGNASFIVNFADNSQGTTIVPIGTGGVAILPASQTRTTTAGIVRVIVKSDVWHDATGFHVTELEAV